MLAPGETCRAVNNEDYPIKIGWGNVEYILRPHEDAFVPAEAIINYFGDSRALTNMQRVEQPNGQSAWIPDRDTEVRRLRIKWQNLNMDGGENELHTPSVDVFTLTGNQIPTVASDPEGKLVNPASLTQSENMSRDEVIAKMQAQLDTLLTERNLQQMVVPATVESEIPIDVASQDRAPRKTVLPKAANDE